MIRIIDGIPFYGKSGNYLKVKAYDLGNGHVEVTASRTVEWHECNWDQQVWDHYLEAVEKKKSEPGYEEEKREKHAEQSARRAKKRVRQLCKVMGVDTMLTLTYRENVKDLALCKKHLKEFNRRILRVLPEFSFVAAFERQDRGAWHVHMATRRIPTAIVDRNQQNAIKVKSYDLIRRIWRSITLELGGTVNVSRRKAHAHRSPAQIASYIAGYITKEYAEGEKWSNRWTKYGEGEVPEPIALGLVSTPLQAVELAYAQLGELHTIAAERLDRFKDWFVLHAELKPSVKHVSIAIE